MTGEELDYTPAPDRASVGGYEVSTEPGLAALMAWELHAGKSWSWMMQKGLLGLDMTLTDMADFCHFFIQREHPDVEYKHMVERANPAELVNLITAMLGKTMEAAQAVEDGDPLGA